jgi:dTDP-4-amino-4,6-dideoxygalactose transaminase
VLGGQKYTHPAVGYNSRLDELQAAVLRVKLPHLDSWNRFRQKHARQYRSRLRDAGVWLPGPSRDGSHVYCLFTIRCAARDELRRHLRERGIGTEIYYPLPLHLQEAYRDLGYREGELPVSEMLCRQTLSIPVYPELTREQVDRVADAVVEFVRGRARVGTEEAVGQEL